MLPLCSLSRKEYYTLGIDGVAVPARECVTSPHELCRALIEHWQLNMDLGEAVRQPKAGSNVDHGLFKCPAFFICNRLQPQLWRVRPTYRNSLRMLGVPALIFPLIFPTAFHEVSVYPKKELPFFILFTAGLCSFTAMLALLTHQFPELMGVFAKAVSICQEGGLREGEGKAREAT